MDKCAQTWQVGLGKVTQAEVDCDQTPSRRAPGASMAQCILDLFDLFSVLECSAGDRCIMSAVQ